MTNQTFIKHKLKNVINISKIVTVHYFEFDKNYNFDGEAHDFWEMVYVDKGEISITAENKNLVLKQGEAFFHQPNEFHTIKANKIIAPNIFVITFVCKSKDMSFFKNKHVKMPSKLKDLIAQIIIESRKTFNLPLFDPNIKELTLKESPVFGGEQLIKVYLEMLLIMLIRIEQNILVFSSKEVMNDHLTTQVIDILAKNLYNKIDINYISKLTNYGKTYLCTVFKNSTGYSIKAYYLMLKISEAKKLIRENNYNFTEISELLSFSSPYYFSHAFKKLTGMSPSEYLYSVKSD